MATRGETKTGQSLGMRFAAQGGARMHLNTQELELLFSLDESEKLSGETSGWTAGEWLDEWKESTKADMTDMKRWGRKGMEDSLTMESETRLFLDKDGQLCKGTMFKR